MNGGGAETTHFGVYEDIKSTFPRKIVTESIVVDISHGTSVRLIFLKIKAVEHMHRMCIEC